MLGKLTITILLISVISAVQASWRNTISVVGSSTVFPFITVVAERFGKSTKFPTPKVESTGTGGGIKLFCSGVDIDTPDMTNASRRMKPTELGTCISNGVTDVVEVLVGFDGIVFSNAIEAPTIEITTREIYLALAAEVPENKDSTTLIRNPYSKWSEINPELPDTEITVYGPPPTSGTRDAFVELIMEAGCAQYSFIAALADVNEDKFKQLCHSLRDDGRYIDSGENDNLIVRKLTTNKDAFGVFGFSFLDQNTDSLKGTRINGALPTFEEIADGSYPISRPLYVYVKSAHVDNVPGMKEFLEELISDASMGEEGYLADRGLIPLKPDVRRTVRNAVINLEILEL